MNILILGGNSQIALNIRHLFSEYPISFFYTFKNKTDCVDKYSCHLNLEMVEHHLQGFEDFIASNNNESRNITHFQTRIWAKLTLLVTWKLPFLTKTDGLDFCRPDQLAIEIQKTIDQLKAPKENWVIINSLRENFIDSKILILEKRLLEVPD